MIDAYFVIPTDAIKASWRLSSLCAKLITGYPNGLKFFLSAALLIMVLFSSISFAFFAPESITMSSTPRDFIFSVSVESSSRLFATIPRIAFSAFAIFAIASALPEFAP